MPTDSQAVACSLSWRSPCAGRRKQEKTAGLILISDYPEVPEESTDFCLSEFFIMHKCRSRPGDPLTLSVLFYSSIQGFAEVLANRENLTIPKKEWFLAILKSEHRR